MFLKKYERQLYALMRIISGFLFLWHGSQKLFGIPGGTREMAAHIQFIAGPVEFFGGLLIMFGLFTSWAAFISSGLMAAAYWMAHGTNALLPVMNRGELAALYCFVFLFIAARGAGIWSIDSVIAKKSAQ